MNQGYRILEHPSDVGIEARGESLRQAFESAGRGMLAFIVDPDSVHGAETKCVTITGTDPENLLVRWLSEILFQYDGKGFIASGIEIQEMSANGLKAVLTGETANLEKHRFRTDVKAVTYHQVKVETTAEESIVRVFFDL
jgi:SHS2 domain-containing protein